MISPGSGLLPQSLTARNCVAVSATARRAMSSNHVPTMRTTHHRGDLPPAVGTGLAAGRPCGANLGATPYRLCRTASRPNPASAVVTGCPPDFPGHLVRAGGVKGSPVPPGRVRRPAYIGISQWVLAIRAERGRLRYADLDVGIPRALAPRPRPGRLTAGWKHRQGADACVRQCWSRHAAL